MTWFLHRSYALVLRNILINKIILLSILSSGNYFKHLSSMYPSLPSSINEKIKSPWWIKCGGFVWQFQWCLMDHRSQICMEGGLPVGSQATFWANHFILNGTVNLTKEWRSLAVLSWNNYSSFPDIKKICIPTLKLIFAKKKKKSDKYIGKEGKKWPFPQILNSQKSVCSGVLVQALAIYM